MRRSSVGYVRHRLAGARQSLRYLGDLIGDHWSILFFPEGQRTEAGEINPFQPGIGLIAARLGVPVVPIRLRGLDKVLHKHMRRPRPGRVEIAFGAPLHLKGEVFPALASSGCSRSWLRRTRERR